eukprot:scaffold124794_cov58-Attheya_sp.AAC.1
MSEDRTWEYFFGGPTSCVPGTTLGTITPTEHQIFSLFPFGISLDIFDEDDRVRHLHPTQKSDKSTLRRADMVVSPNDISVRQPLTLHALHHNNQPTRLT